MKMFTKLALVSSMAIVSVNAMAALVANTDAQDAAVTGQDGINIGIGISKIEIDKVLIHDNDGLRYNTKSWGSDTPATAAVARVIGVDANNDGDFLDAGDTAPVEPVAAQAGYGGTTAAQTARAGAIVIKGNGIADDVNETKGIVITAPMTVSGGNLVLDTARALTSHNLADISIDTEAGAGGANTAFLNVAAKVSGLDIYIGEIGVAASNAKPGASATSIRRGATDTSYSTTNTSGNYNKILSGLTLKTGQMDANIQLGAAPQGAMIALNTSMIGGLEIKNLGILDSSTAKGLGNGTSDANRAAGEIRLDSIKVADASGLNLTVDARVSVVGKTDTSDGYLQIVTGSGTTTPATDIYISGVHLGSKNVVAYNSTGPVLASSTSIGDVEVQGLQTYYNDGAANVKGAVITISGH